MKSHRNSGSRHARTSPRSSPGTLGVAGIADHVFHKALCLEQRGLNLLLHYANATIEIPDDDDDDDEDNPGLGYAVRDGIATIPICGVLLKSESLLTRAFGIVTYESIRAQIMDCLANPGVKGILLDVDSPGGESAGCANLADFIYQARYKPIFACSNDAMFSAAYWIGSSAERLFVTRDGGCGSIGCYILHLDRSGKDEQFGLKFTYIVAKGGTIDIRII